VTGVSVAVGVKVGVWVMRGGGVKVAVRSGPRVGSSAALVPATTGVATGVSVATMGTITGSGVAVM